MFALTNFVLTTLNIRTDAIRTNVFRMKVVVSRETIKVNDRTLYFRQNQNTIKFYISNFANGIII